MRSDKSRVVGGFGSGHVSSGAGAVLTHLAAMTPLLLCATLFGGPLPTGACCDENNGTCTIETEAAWDESPQALITFDGCEDSIEGRWEGLIPIESIRREKNDDDRARSHDRTGQ